MERNSIAVLDSGIGGISVLCELNKKLKNQKIIYFGDNLNAPYGEKSKEELLNLTIKNINKLLKYNLKCIVFACNTLSTNILPEIENIFKIKCFGVVPPVNENPKNKKTVLICTPRTASNYKDSDNLIVLPFRNLAGDIENNFYNQNKINLFDHFSTAYIERYNKKIKNNNEMLSFFSDKSLILGCTHYELIKNKIFNHFQPQCIISGSNSTVISVYEYIKNTKNISKNLIIFSGKCCQKNKKVFENIYFNK